MMDRHINTPQNASNQNETEYDKRFQEDLEKATALSLETLALEEFRRNKLHLTSVNDVSGASSIIKFSTCKYRPYTLAPTHTNTHTHIFIERSKNKTIDRACMFYNGFV